MAVSCVDPSILIDELHKIKTELSIKNTQSVQNGTHDIFYKKKNVEKDG